MADPAILLGLLEISAKLLSAEQGVEAAKNSGKEAAKINAVTNITGHVVDNIGAHVRQLVKQKHDIAVDEIRQGYHEKNASLDLANYKIRLGINRLNLIETNKIRLKFSDESKVYILPSLVRMLARNYNHEKKNLLQFSPQSVLR